MWKTPARIALLVLLPASALAQDASAVIADASGALGVTGVTSLTWSGVAAEGNFGQSRTISFGLASTSISNYTVTLDFAAPAARVTGATVGGPIDRAISAGTPWPEQFQLWVTPWGFVKGAAANAATVKSQKIEGVQYRVVTWVPPLKAPSGQSYRVVGYINPDNFVERVETWVEHPIFGDMHVETRYSNYRDFGGLRAPTRIAQRKVGMETYVAAIQVARASPPDLAQLMAGAPPAPPPAPPSAAATSEKIAEGVYRITGDYGALAVEFRDYAVVIEAGGSEARGLAILAETKRLFPGKRIRYVVNTHPHFDHAAGLPPFVAEGIPILIDDPSRYFLEQALRSPRTLVGDVLGKSRRKATVESVIEKLVLTDGTRSLELHHLERFDHSDAMLVAYLPKERILFTADIPIPAEGQPAGPGYMALVQNLERLGITVDRHITVHAQP